MLWLKFTSLWDPPPPPLFNASVPSSLMFSCDHFFFLFQSPGLTEEECVGEIQSTLDEFRHVNKEVAHVTSLALAAYPFSNGKYCNVQIIQEPFMETVSYKIITNWVLQNQTGILAIGPTQRRDRSVVQIIRSVARDTPQPKFVWPQPVLGRRPHPG